VGKFGKDKGYVENCFCLVSVLDDVCEMVAKWYDMLSVVYELMKFEDKCCRCSFAK